MKPFLIISLLLSSLGFSQYKNLIDDPFIHVYGKADTLVTPNKITIKIILSEKDTKNKKTIEELENEMLKKLKFISIADSCITAKDIASEFKKYFLKETDILKTKIYYVKTTDAKTTAKVFIGLEEIGISNVSIEKLEHSEAENIKLILNAKAILNAKQNAVSFAKPLGQNVGKAMVIDESENNIYNSTTLTQSVIIRGTSSSKYDSDNYNVNINFESITFTSSVKVVFLLL